MDLEKMSVEELRDIACGTRIYWLNAFDELVRRLALKDADLLLERDRAEKAESQVAEAQKLHELDERIIRVSADAAELQNNKLEKLEAQVKILVEALSDPDRHEDNCLFYSARNQGCTIEDCDCWIGIVLAKIKEVPNASLSGGGTKLK